MKTLLILLAPALLLAQAHPPGPPLPPDDRSLYRLFFSFYYGLITNVENAQRQDAKAGAKGCFRPGTATKFSSTHFWDTTL